MESISGNRCANTMVKFQQIVSELKHCGIEKPLGRFS